MPNRRHIVQLIVMTAFCLVASAHHFKGLPHFNYFENYPQVPQEEFLGQAGNFEFSLVTYDFQGIKKEDAQQPDGVRLFVAIYNLREGKTYQGPLTMRVLDHGVEIARREFEQSEEESLYRMEATLPIEGKYSLALDFRADDIHTEMPFVLSGQKVHWGKWIAGGLLALIAVVAVGSRRARVSVDRRENAKMRVRQTVAEGGEHHG